MGEKDELNMYPAGEETAEVLTREESDKAASEILGIPLEVLQNVEEREET